MHRKRVFTIAAVFLIIAVVVPPVIVILSANNSIYKYIIPGTNPTQGSPTMSITLTNQERTNFQNAVIIAAVIEVIFLSFVHHFNLLWHKPHTSKTLDKKTLSTWCPTKVSLALREKTVMSTSTASSPIFSLRRKLGIPTLNLPKKRTFKKNIMKSKAWWSF